MLASEQIKNSNAKPMQKNKTINEQGKVRVLAFDFTASKIINVDEDFALVNIPSASIKILSAQFKTVDIAKDITFNLHVLDKNNNTTIELINKTPLGNEGMHEVFINKNLDSTNGSILCAKGSISIAKDSKLNGFILYVAD